MLLLGVLSHFLYSFTYPCTLACIHTLAIVNNATCIRCTYLFYFFEFFKLIFIGVQLLYNVLLVPAVQQSESVTRTHTAPLPWLSFPFRSLHNTGFPVLYSGFSLVVYFIHGSVYMSIPIPQSIPMSWGDFLVLFWSHFCRLIQLKKKTP